MIFDAFLNVGVYLSLSLSFSLSVNNKWTRSEFRNGGRCILIVVFIISKESGHTLHYTMVGTGTFDTHYYIILLLPSSHLPQPL